ncbi:hypothetical protein [Enterococcus faecium]|uniref:Uncharacterized protein n=1 Tax=Enterococcus faecium TaxID=1352 RepID=A0AAW8RIH0_ENTFC|nr:hypothetical protein [Enterococcus faecium]MBW4142936.1 hypothetical protein [Enterococcus faecium]MDT2309155.1 hypothetical protein [Enterococcus faecium]MDT2365821.1 hypothetical protein [Enterococcus faecium]MDT2369972.1 hypothetical protein [Enterococcus faecium]UZN39653.1 hypothetical protein MZO31_05880 [Enterococcus faecium]
MAAKRIKPNTNLKETQNHTAGIPRDAATLSYHSLGKQNADQEHPCLNLKYYDFNFECFSELSQEDLKSFTALNRKFRDLTWLQIKQQSGKTNKSGLAPTKIPRNKLPKSPILDAISEDIEILELRLSKKARVFGFRSAATFFLIFLDSQHRICP